MMKWQRPRAEGRLSVRRIWTPTFMSLVVLAGAMAGVALTPGLAEAQPQVTLYVAPSGSGDCTSQPNACGSVQTAISTATGGSYAGYDVTIDVGAGTYDENDIVDASSLDSLTIAGAGASSTFLNGSGSGTVLVVDPGTVTISGITIENGNNPNGGGVIGCDSVPGCNLTVSHSTFSDDAASNWGGAIDFGDNGGDGTLTVTDSTFTGDTAGAGGGAINIGSNGGDATVIVTNSTFTNDSAAASGRGGAIDNGDDAGNGQVTVAYSTFTGNSADWGGGAIANGNDGGQGSVTIGSSTFTGNAAIGNNVAGAGGVIDNSRGTVIVADSTFAGNQATNGGAINNGDNAYDSGMPGTLTVSNSTFSLNSAATDGGAVDSADNGGTGTATITSSTFSENYATDDGGSVDSADNGGTGAIDLGATILAGAPTGGECAGSTTDLGYNIADDATCGFTATGSVNNSATLDVTLGALKQNQGSTQTILPDSNSPAVGAIPNDTNVGATPVCPTTDQQAVSSAPGGSCDIGSTQTTFTAPTISAVTFAGTPASPTVTVWGSGFGTQANLGAPVAAYGGGTGSDYGQQFYLLDGFGAGEGDGPFGDFVGLSISSYSDDQITFSFGSLYSSYGPVNQGDSFSMTVLGTTFNGTVSYPGHPQAGPAPYAYVTNSNSGTVTPISTSTGTADTPITVGSRPGGIAITPNGQTAYVVNLGSDSVTPITTATNTAGTPIPVGASPQGIGITPNGTIAYVANYGSGTVTPISTATNTAGSAITVGSGPADVAITPDGQTAYVVDGGSNEVTPIATATNTPGTPIPVGNFPQGIAITPDGQTAYVANNLGGTVTPINLATQTVESPITVGANPSGIAITPDGQTAYVTSSGNTVTPIDLSTNTAESPITAGSDARGITVSPDGQTAYMADYGDNTVIPIATSTGIPGSPISVGGSPVDVAVMPDQGPTASLSASTTATTTTFDATTSVPGTTPIVSYAWNFGDGSPTVDTSTPTTTHTYATGVCAGTVPSPSCDATVTETDAAGASTTQVTTGRTVSLNGSTAAVASTEVTIAVADCTTDNTCQAAVTTSGTPMSPPQAVSVTVPAAGSQTGTLTVTSGAGQLGCSHKGFRVASAITSYSASFVPTGNVDVSDLITGPTKTKGIQICFQGSAPAPSFLKKCSPRVPAPCATLAVVPSGVQATILVPGSDPRFRIDGVQTLTESPKSVGAKGIIGKTLAISGSDLLTSTGQTRPTVSFTSLSGSTIAGAVTSATATKLAVLVPNGAATGPVSIAWPDEVLTSEGSIAIGPPTVSSLNPATGSPNGGTSVTITGTGFTGATAVKFGTTEATSFVVHSATSLTAVSPEGTAAVDVTVTTKGGTSATVAADKFTYSGPGPARP